MNLLPLMPGEKITSIVPMKEIDDEKYLFMATRNGMVKKTPMKEYSNVRKNGLQAIVLRDDDELIEVKATDNTEDIFLITKKGMCIRFHETDVRVTGRVSMGVIGMKFDEGDEVIGMQMASSGLIGCPNLANPRPEKSAYACVASSYAPTEIARLAVDGIVSVVSGDAVKKRVSLFSAMPAGSHRSY